VNLPNLAVDAASGSHRVAHLHVNVPGVLATVNRVFAEHGVNIDGQQLATRGELGYVISDIASGLTQDAVAALRDMPETVRLRVLS